MAIASVQARFARTTNLPEDIVVNTFHFFTSGASVSAADAAAVAQKVQNFYKRPDLPGSAPTNIMSDVIMRGNVIHEIRVYDLGDPKPRQPKHSQLFAINPSTTATMMPSEVAAVLSLKCPVPLGGVPARYRGRIYFGPLTTSVATGVVAGDVRITVAARNLLLDSAEKMLAAPADLIAWSVYSPTNQQVNRITQVCINDAFDTQRRRGAAPIERICRSLPGPV